MAHRIPSELDTPEKQDARNAPSTCAFIYIQASKAFKFSQRRMKMRMPSSIATWCLILFFLFYGLQALGMGIPGIILGLLALGVAVSTLIGR